MSKNSGNSSTRTQATPGGAILSWLLGPWPISLLFSSFLVLGLSAVQQKSPTFDEPVHVTGGYSYWAYNDYRLHPENGNWSERWVALQVWLVGFNFPTTKDEIWQRGSLWELADAFFFARGNNADAMIRLGRMMQAVPALALALLVYLWSSKLFGDMGGLISLTLCVCSPTILGYGFFVTSEMGVTLFLLAATWAVWTLLHRVTPGTVALAGFAVSGAALTKFSGLVILPISAVLICARLTNPAPWTVDFRGAREVRGRLRQSLLMMGLAALVTMMVVAVIWASFGFRYSIFGPAATAADHVLRPWESLRIRSDFMRWLVESARERRLLPEGYLYGLSHVLATTQSQPSFLNGEFSRTGFRSYFLYCLALKTPLTLFLLLLLAEVGAWIKRGRTPPQETAWALRWRGLYELIPLLSLWSIFLGFALSSNLNIGHRHIMPIYPAMFVLAGGAAVWFRGPTSSAAAPKGEANEAARLTEQIAAPARSSRTMRAVILGTLLFTVAEAVWIWPNYVAYFNILAGGRRHAYRHLVDSSLDWGQDLKGLTKWLNEHPQEAADQNRVYFSYFGSADYKYYGLQARLLPSFNKWRRQDAFSLTGGLYCISATNVQSVYGPFPGRWNKEYESRYQDLRPVANAYLTIRDDAAARSAMLQQVGEEKLNEALEAYEHLRFGRLCAFLRTREPDDDVGGSILIYRLTDEDVRQALEGPLPAETLARPES